MGLKMKYMALLLTTTILVNCDRGPKIISTPINESTEYSKNKNQSSTGIFNNGEVTKAKNNEKSIGQMSDVHTVMVDEVLPTQKYVYMKVTEGEDSYWIATGKQEVEVGKQYFFKGGLLKTNFESKEYNRVFDKVYLVSKVVPLNHGQDKIVESKPKESTQEAPNKFKLTFNHGDEFVKISDLVKNPSKYAGKKIKMTGQCTKLNANIMGMNWIHLKDGSMDEYDLVLTSSTAVPEGHIIKVEGTVAVDKDFGAGYKYDILVEDAVMLN